ncbi:DUF4374 domain-containing protein [Arcticibacter eurypsychrophilus]|uniref:DUF4374 domain-containing protein n=1 Tax=Arcticibacter eurypsychrophilus TaxID=1434752 RepID=UPI00084D1723|nr:DUF4374 domain-containing protein [Arcticibacter eurypsychrophilus]
MNNKNLFNTLFFAALAVSLASCSKDNDDTTVDAGTKVYALGVGVTTTEATTNYVIQTSDLMSGTISPVGNGLLQTGYRDYAFGGTIFYSVGGLGVTDVNTISLDASDKLTTKTGLVFDAGNTDFKDVDGTGKTMIGLSSPGGPTAGLNASFYTVNVATNAIITKVNVPVNSIYPSAQDWILHTGLEVSGSRLYQTFYPINATTYVTQNTDNNYVAIYSYPGFVLEKVITDTRTGPSGGFNTRSGIFKTESGDLYTVSHNSYGYSKKTKAAGILKIASGTTVFDANYYFNTETATNGGKIIHAMYVGNNKLFAEITNVASTGQWADASLKFAIVDLSAKTITPVVNSPLFDGNGGRSFAALLEDGKVYAAATVNSVCNIYQVDLATATATKGATIQATFLGGIARLK